MACASRAKCALAWQRTKYQTYKSGSRTQTYRLLDRLERIRCPPNRDQAAPHPSVCSRMIAIKGDGPIVRSAASNRLDIPKTSAFT